MIETNRMSKRQSTIQSFFHSLRESKEKPVPDNNADNEICSGTENKCPNGASLKNKSNDEDVSESRNKKIKLSEIKLDNSESKNVKNIDKKPFEDQISSKKQIISLCNDFKGALDINIGISWFDALQKEFGKPYFRKLDDFLQQVHVSHTISFRALCFPQLFSWLMCCFQYSFKQERKNHTIFPPHEQVWSWTQHFKVTDTRVVIIGQDPYHGPMQAHGLCFSVKHGVKPPPSLLNMYKELERDNDVQFIRPKHGFLEGWSKQGVLLLNAVLTVRSGQANSHKVTIYNQTKF